MRPQPADPVVVPEFADEDLARWRADGFLVLRGLVPPAAAAAMHDEVMELMRAVGLGVTKLRQTGDYRAGSLLDAYINGRGLRTVASRLLKGSAHLYMPFTAVKSVGGGAFGFHQDNQYTPLDGPALNLWTALMPIGDAEGGLRLVPGSHAAGTLPSRPQEDGGHRQVLADPDRWVVPDLAPGDCVAFTRLTVHGSGPNRGALPRVAYAVQFAREDVRAFFDDAWELLTVRPRWRREPTERIGAPAGGDAH